MEDSVAFPPMVVVVLVAIVSCSGSTDALDDSLFGAANFRDRQYSVAPQYCGEEDIPQNVLDDRAFIASQRELIAESDNPDESLAAVTAIELCEALDISGDFTVPAHLERATGYFYLNSTSLEDHWYWMFVFVNNKDYTSRYFGERNLVKLTPNDEVVFNFDLDVDALPVVLSILAIDARAREQFFATNYLQSTVVKSADALDSKVSRPTFIDGLDAENDPYPESLTYAIRGDEVQLNFTDFEEGGRETIDFTVFDMKRGEIVNLNCGGITSDIVTVSDSQLNAVNPTRVNCFFPTNVSFENVVINSRFNLFTDNHWSEYPEFLWPIRVDTFE